MGNTLIYIGIIIIIAGLLFNLIGMNKIPWLPGDIFIKKDHVTFYFPIVTSIIVSIILTIIINMIRK